MRTSIALSPGSWARRLALAARTIAKTAATCEASHDSWPRRVIARCSVGVIAPILRRRGIGEDLVVGHVVLVDVVASRPANDRRADAQVADQRRHRDVDHIVSEAPTVRPAT